MIGTILLIGLVLLIATLIVFIYCCIMINRGDDDE